MGLRCSHDAFHGAYSAFNRLRQAVAEAAGGSYPPHDNPVFSPSKWYIHRDFDSPGLVLFLDHSDSDGVFTPNECRLVAEDLEKLLDEVSEKYGGGHIARDGGVRAVLKKFIAGCRAAADAEEDLEFR